MMTTNAKKGINPHHYLLRSTFYTGETNHREDCMHLQVLTPGELGQVGSLAFATGLLVVIDMQNVFADPSSQAFVPGFACAAAAVLQLLPVFTGRTIYTRFVAPAEPQGAWKMYYERWPFLLRPATDPIWHISSIFRTEKRHTITKHTFSKWAPELAAAIGSTHDLVLVGVSTDCCVLATALAAADAGARIHVVVDGCAGSSLAAHEQALNIMALHSPLIEVITAEDLMKCAAYRSLSAEM